MATAARRREGESNVERLSYTEYLAEKNRRTAAGFVVMGNTYPVKAELAAAGGIWCKRLKAWLMPDDETTAAGRFLVASQCMQVEPRAADTTAAPALPPTAQPAPVKVSHAAGYSYNRQPGTAAQPSTAPNVARVDLFTRFDF